MPEINSKEVEVLNGLFIPNFVKTGLSLEQIQQINGVSRYKETALKKRAPTEAPEQVPEPSHWEPQLNVSVGTPEHSSSFLEMAGSDDYSQEDLLTNALYIFLLIVAATIVVGGSLFGLREYYISRSMTTEEAREIEHDDIERLRRYAEKEEVLKGKTDVQQMNELNQDEVDKNDDEDETKELYNAVGANQNGGTTVELEQEAVCDKLTVEVAISGNHLPSSLDTADHPKTVSETGQELSSEITSMSSVVFDPKTAQEAFCIEVGHSSTSDYYLDRQMKDEFIKEYSRTDKKVQKLDLFHDEVDSNDFTSGGSISHFLKTQFASDQSEIAKPINRYSFKQLHEIKRKPQTSFLFEQNPSVKTQVKISSIMRYSSVIPMTVFESIWQADKSIRSLRAAIALPSTTLEHASRSMDVLAVLSIGASYEMLDNPNLYLAAFTDFVEDILDSGEFFNTIEGAEAGAQRLLMDMVVVYCWSHWNFKTRNNSKPREVEKMKKSYNDSYQFEPTVHTHQTVFRLMCNLELGICGIEQMDAGIRLTSEFKIHVLLKETAKCLFCTEYIGIIPMLSQAVGLTPVERSKYLFYEVLKTVVEKHSECCMRDYLNETRTELKPLVQHGLWHQHGSKICIKANEIYAILVNKNPSIRSWWDEVEGGKLYVATGTLPEQATSPVQLLYTAPQKPETSNRPSTPGAWTKRLANFRTNQPQQEQEQ